MGATVSLDEVLNDAGGEENGNRLGSLARGMKLSNAIYAKVATIQGVVDETQNLSLNKFSEVERRLY